MKVATVKCAKCGKSFQAPQSIARRRVNCSNACRYRTALGRSFAFSDEHRRELSATMYARADGQRDRHEARRVPAEFILRTMHDYALELQDAGRNER